MNTKTILAGILVAAVSLPVFAQHKPPIHSTANMEKMKPRNGVSAKDRMFVKDAAIANMAEIKLGQLAQRRGASWGKAYGRDMEREHGMAQKELWTVAHSKRIALPADIDAKHKAVWAKLSRLSGAAFDSAYRAEMIKGHQMVLMGIRSEMRNGNDTTVKGYAIKMEPAVEMHLRMAQEKKSMMSHH